MEEKMALFTIHNKDGTRIGMGVATGLEEAAKSQPDVLATLRQRRRQAIEQSQELATV